MPTILRTPETHVIENRRNLIRNPRGTTVPASGNYGLAPQWYGSGGVGTTTSGVTETDLPEGVTTFIRKRWTTAPATWTSIGFQFNVGARMPVTAGQVIHVRYWWRPSTALTLTFNRLLLEVYSAASSGSYLGQVFSDNLPAPSAETWQLVEATLVVPFSGFMILAHQINATAGAVNGMTIDGTAALLSIDADGTYFDGSSTPYGNISYAWTGTAGASESVENATVPVVSITPTIVNGYRSEREARSIVHPILGRTTPDVTLRPASLRTGNLELLFRDEADAVAASAHLAAGRLWQLESDERDVNMTFVTPEGERIGLELDDETRDGWRLTVPFQEVA